MFSTASFGCCGPAPRGAICPSAAGLTRAHTTASIAGAHDVTYAEALLEGLEPCAVVIGDKAYDADRIRAQIRAQGAISNIPSPSHRRRKSRWTKALYRERNHIERFFNKLKQNRRIATRYDKLGATFFAFVKLAAVRVWLRSIESTA